MSGDTFVAWNPRPWSEVQISATMRAFSLSDDGKRFAIVPPRELPPVAKGLMQVTFVLNFPEELQRLVKK